MKKLNHILLWDDYFIEGYALFLMILGCFYPWIFVVLGIYLYWQRRSIKIPVILFGISLLLIRFYMFENIIIPIRIDGEAKIEEINSYEYSDMLILSYHGNRFQAFVSQGIYQVGDIITIEAEVKHFRGQSIPYGFNQESYYLSQNVRGYLEIHTISYVRHSFSIYTLREQMNVYLSHFQSQIYLKALILGEKSFTEEQSSLYHNLGILYLFTVSGLHVYGLLFFIRKIFFYFSLSEKSQFILTSTILLIVLYFNQFSMSVLRIVLIYLLHHFSRKMKMSLSQLDIIHLVFFSMLIYRIEWIYNLGFLMLFIILNFINLMSHTYSQMNGYLKRLMLSLIIIFSILPFQTSISFFLILLLPVIMIFLAGFIYTLSISVLFIPELDQLLWLMLNHFEQLMQWLASRNVTITLPSLPIFGILVYYLFLISLFRSQSLMILLKRSTLIILLFSIFIFDIKFSQETNIYMIDVGQGDSILLESPSCNLLIDSFQNVLTLLNDLGIYHLDYLILTHSDTDHIQEAQSIIDQVHIDQVIINPYNDYPIYHEKMIPMKSDDQIRCGIYSIQFLGPIHEYDDLNNNSLVFKTVIGNKTFLFTGDIEKEAEEDLISKYGNRLKSDVLKVAHHGSSTSSTIEFIAFVDPEVALISVGQNNRYGFPSQEVIARLMMSQINIYRTDTMGTIVYTYHQKKGKWFMYLPF